MESKTVLGFGRITRGRFRNPSTGFQIFSSGAWIPDSFSCIPDSTCKNFQYSGIRIPLHEDSILLYCCSDEPDTCQ